MDIYTIFTAHFLNVYIDTLTLAMHMLFSHCAQMFLHQTVLFHG